MTPKLAVLMPAYEERRELSPTLASLARAASGRWRVTVFVVDDGSEPALEVSAETSAVFDVIVARHPINLGQGAALETARQLALAVGGFAAYVTMDSDGQHGADDALRLADRVVAGADVVFGDRFHGDSNVPLLRGLVLRLARVFERAVTGLDLADAHNGLRAFSARAIERIVIRQNGMAHATEIKQLVRRASPLVIAELPVSVRYTKESLAKGQPTLGAFRILRDLFMDYLFGEETSPP
jgi:glycosyltransferase involved in cell wall biosynthesis